MRFHMLQNVQMALDFLRFKKIKLVNIRAEDIVDSKYRFLKWNEANNAAGAIKSHLNLKNSSVFSSAPADARLNVSSLFSL